MIEPGGSLFDQYGPGSQSDRPSVFPGLGPGSRSEGGGGGGGSPSARPASPAPPRQTTTAAAQPVKLAWGRVKLPFMLAEKDAPLEVAAPAWTSSTYYTAGQVVVSLEPVGASYECTQTGTSGAAQPSGKGSSISDGTCIWKYVQDGIARVNLQRFVAALCEGGVSAVYRIWQDKTFWDQSQAGQWRALNLAAGDATNAVVLSSGGHYRYPYTACLCAPPWGGGATPWFSTGTQKELPQFAAEVQANQCGDTSSQDVNPALIAHDLLTNARYGGRWDPAWVPLDALGSAGSLRTWCDAFGFRISLTVDGEETLLSTLDRILAACNAERRISGAVLQFLPLGDVASSSPVYGSTNYIPSNVAACDILTDQDCLEPLDVEIRRDAERFNIVPISYLDRAAGYVERPVESPDIADVLTPGRGERRAPTTSLGVVFPDGSKAPAMLSRILAQRSLYCTRTFTLQLPLRFMRLEGGDILTITDTLLGLDHVPVRIVSVEEQINDDGRRSITVVAEDWPTGVASAQGFTPQSQDGVASQQATTISAIATPAAASQAQTAATIAQAAAEAAQGTADGAVSALAGKAATDLSNVIAQSVTQNLLANSAVGLAQLAAGAVDLSKLASGLRAPRTVSSLPASPFTGWSQGDLAVLTTDNKLYRFTGSGFTAAVPTGDLSGTIGTTQIADDAISTPKLAAGAVTADEIGANAITAGKIAADAVAAANIQAGAIVAGKLAADAVTANTIVAGAIGARELAAGAIATKNLTIGDWDNLFPNPNGDPTKKPTGWTAVSPNDDAEFQWATVVGDSPTGFAHRITAGAYESHALIVVPTRPGEQFYMEATGRRVSGSGQFGLYYYFINSAGGSMAEQGGVFRSHTDFQTFSWTTMQAPAGAVAVAIYCFALSGVTADFTRLYARRMAQGSIIVDGAITAAKIEAGQLKTSNYAEDGSGNPTAGAKLDHLGTALKVAAGNLQIGAYSAEQLFIGKTAIIPVRVFWWSGHWNVVAGAGCSASYSIVNVNPPNVNGLRVTLYGPSWSRFTQWSWFGDSPFITDASDLTRQNWRCFCAAAATTASGAYLNLDLVFLMGNNAYANISDAGFNTYCGFNGLVVAW